MNLSAAELSALSAGFQNIGIFFYLATTPAIRLWAGVGKINPGINAIDLTGQEYKGFGELVEVPTLRQLLNGAAERFEFVLSGVSETMLALAQDDAVEVKGKTGALGFALMDTEWQPIGEVHWIRRFIADYLSIRQDVVENPESGIVRTIALSVGTQVTNRRQPALSFFTDNDQRRRTGSPFDRFCERVGLYSQEQTKTWPDF